MFSFLRMPYPNNLYAIAYPLFRYMLFACDPEASHDMALSILEKTGKYLPACHLFDSRDQAQAAQYQQWGLTFRHRLGLAAGLDKNGRCLAAWEACGFGFIEIGTVTPKPQAGNPKPRLFRYPHIHALVNRLGFNNAGAAAVAAHLLLQKSRCVLPVGVNIGKNKDTAIADAVNDYCLAYRAVQNVADYITVNISSPNTLGLRDLQGEDYLKQLINQLKEEQYRYAQVSGRYTPLWFKLAPDLPLEQVERMCAIFCDQGADAIVATNTTVQRPAGTERCEESGGLSGSPLYAIAAPVVTHVLRCVGSRIPVVAVGGIDSLEKAKHVLDQGASLLQLYTAFIYQGPAWLAQLVRGLHFR